MLTVDPTQLIQMGNMILRYGTGAIAGYVRLNGLTIGSVTSGATERANADCQNLFQYLWGVDSTLAVSGGRGASALADWTANKQMAVPDWRGYNVAGLDDMGNAAAGRLGAYFANPTVLGSAGGAPSAALAAGNIPPHTHSGTTGGMNASNPHSHGVNGGTLGGTLSTSVQGGATFLAPVGTSTIGINATDINHAHPFTTDGGAGLAGSAFGIISPRKLCTAYLKL